MGHVLSVPKSGLPSHGHGQGLGMYAFSIYGMYVVRNRRTPQQLYNPQEFHWAWGCVHIIQKLS